MPPKINEEIIAGMRKDRQDGMLIKDICDKYDVSEWTVKTYCKGIKPEKTREARLAMPERKYTEDDFWKYVAAEFSVIKMLCVLAILSFGLLCFIIGLIIGQ